MNIHVVLFVELPPNIGSQGDVVGRDPTDHLVDDPSAREVVILARCRVGEGLLVVGD